MAMEMRVMYEKGGLWCTSITFSPLSQTTRANRDRASELDESIAVSSGAVVTGLAASISKPDGNRGNMLGVYGLTANSISLQTTSVKTCRNIQRVRTRLNRAFYSAAATQAPQAVSYCIHEYTADGVFIFSQEVACIPYVCWLLNS